MHPGVKYRASNHPTPISPNHWTLQELRRQPFNLWLKFIEPKLVVFGPHEDDCWCIYGRNRNKVVDPVITATQDFEGRIIETKSHNARKFVAEIFYDFPVYYSVYRNKDICTCINCVRPSHLIIAPHNDRIAKFGTPKKGLLR